MRIAVLPYTASGGLSTYALELSRALAERGLDVTLLGVGGGVAGGALHYESLPHIDMLKKNRDPLIWNASIGASASHVLRGSSVDIVHCVYPALVPFICVHEPVVCSGWFSPHDLRARLSIAIRISPPSIHRLGEIWGQMEYFLLDDFGYRSSRFIFAVTKTLEEDLRGRFGGKIRFLPPGIRLALGKRKRGDKRVKIACIASDLELPRKDVSTLLKALALIEPSLSERVEIRLIGSYTNRLEAEVEALRRGGALDIKLLGHMHRMRIYENLIQTDLLVCPSLYEEFGYVVLEAMSAGVPVIATRIPPLMDIVVDGVSGLLYEKRNANQLSSMLSTLIRDRELLWMMGEEARKRIVEDFSWSSIAQSLVNYYKEILEAS